MENYYLTTEKVKQYEIYLREQERAEHTIQKYLYNLQKLQQWLDGRMITKMELIGWKEKLFFCDESIWILAGLVADL